MKSELYRSLWLSILRTAVPVIVGGFLSFLVSQNIPVDPSLEASLTASLTGLGILVYYVAVRFLEVFVTPKLGWLIGSPKSPDTYSSDAPPKPEVALLEDDGLADGAPVQDGVERVDHTTVIG